VTAVAILATAAAAAIASLVALRLLGVRRGWSTGLTAAALGCTAAATASVVWAGGDVGAPPVGLRALVLVVPCTMAVAVILDLAARPGSLAVGDDAGLFVRPRLIRATRLRIQVLGRYLQLIRLLRRAGFGPLLTRRQRRTRAADAAAVRARRVLEEAGGVYVKLGQLAASRVDLLPADVCRELAALDNRVAPVPADSMRTLLETELGVPIDDVFTAFDWEPIAAASIGQTYRAQLRSGEAVVVKIQRPSVRDTIERDIAALSMVTRLAERRTTLGRRVQIRELLDQFASQLRRELDFRCEADAMREVRARLGSGSPVRIPAVNDRLCTRRVIVQERFDGFTVADAAVAALGEDDRRRLGEQLLRVTLDQVFHAGVFHADPHPGNVFILTDATLGLVDFGAVGRLDALQQHGLVSILAAVAHGNAALVLDGLEQITELDPAVPPEQLERVLAHLLARHGRPNGTVEVAVAQDLIRTLTTFDIHLPPEVLTLARTLVTLEGTLRILAPELSIIAAATEALAERGPASIIDRGTFLRDELVSALPHLRRIPERLDRLLTLSSRGEFRIRTLIDENAQRTLRTLVNRGVLAAIGAAVVAVSAFLLVAPGSHAPSPSVLAVLGYGGLLAGAVLLTRVIAAIVRDGTT
jgi:ubiquinone biosynthesis protein